MSDVDVLANVLKKRFSHVVIRDDYGWPGARRAIDEFCAERGIALSVTKNEQAVIIA